jgi:hypothetical protein
LNGTCNIDWRRADEGKGPQRGRLVGGLAREPTVMFSLDHELGEASMSV